MIVTNLLPILIERGQFDMVHRKAIIEIDILGRTCNAGVDPYFAIQLVSSKGSVSIRSSDLWVTLILFCFRTYTFIQIA